MKDNDREQAENLSRLSKVKKILNNLNLFAEPSKKEISLFLNLEDITIEVTFQSRLIIRAALIKLFGKFPQNN